jgi:hypothetical protein
MGYQQAAYEPGAEQPVSASFSAPISGPTPKVPVAGGNVTYRWVSGYMSSDDANAAISAAFRLFDAPEEIAIVIAADPGDRAGVRLPR